MAYSNKSIFADTTQVQTSRFFDPIFAMRVLLKEWTAKRKGLEWMDDNLKTIIQDRCNTTTYTI